MHEMSIVRSLLRQVESLLNDDGVHHGDTELDDEGFRTVSEIELRIGPLSGVEKVLLESAFETLSINTRFHDACLVIRESPLIAVCVECHQESVLENFIFRCHQCGSSEVQVTDGDEIELVSVTIESKEQSKLG